MLRPGVAQHQCGRGGGQSRVGPAASRITGEPSGHYLHRATQFAASIGSSLEERLSSAYGIGAGCDLKWFCDVPLV